MCNVLLASGHAHMESRPEVCELQSINANLLRPTEPHKELPTIAFVKPACGFPTMNQVSGIRYQASNSFCISVKNNPVRQCFAVAIVVKTFTVPSHWNQVGEGIYRFIYLD